MLVRGNGSQPIGPALPEMTTRVEHALVRAFAPVMQNDGPPGLASAMQYAVFPSGGRIRPRLSLAVNAACGGDMGEFAAGAAAAIELLHCASQVLDDLPCFDNAGIRRGRPSVHRAFGESLAVLAGAALIVLAFQTLAQSAVAAPVRLGPMIIVMARAAGMPSGLAAGQAWELEREVDLQRYHRAKTGGLFAAATMAGALAAGAGAEAWWSLGEQLGEAYAAADDIKDMVCTEEELGKPAGQDVVHRRPSAALYLGLEGAAVRLRRLVGEATATIPACPGEAELRSLIRSEFLRVVPKDISSYVADPASEPDSLSAGDPRDQRTATTARTGCGREAGGGGRQRSIADKGCGHENSTM
jgi:geranylgeranyl diphosphate synthase, type II